MLRWLIWQGLKDWSRLQLPLAAVCGLVGGWVNGWMFGTGLDQWLVLQAVGFVVGMSLLGWLGGTGIFLAQYWWKSRRNT